MTVQTLEHQNEKHSELNEIVSGLREDNADKVLSYAAFLRHMERAEDDEDIRSYLERRDEPSYSIEEIKSW